jgi:hypothetical protein
MITNAVAAGAVSNPPVRPDPNTAFFSAAVNEPIFGILW